jgi:DNA-binding transcriptional LysR family regulator
MRRNRLGTPLPMKPRTVSNGNGAAPDSRSMRLTASTMFGALPTRVPSRSMAGMGMSFLSLRATRHEIASGHLALVDIEGLPIVRHWHITHLTAKRLSPAASVFKAFMVEETGPLIRSWA